MGLMQQIYDKTMFLYSFLEQSDRKLEERDQYIEKVEGLLSERQELIAQMQPPYSEEEKKIGLEIAKYDEKINLLLKETLKDIKNDLFSLRQKKQQHSKYDNPYASSYGDGMFLDKRK